MASIAHDTASEIMAEHMQIGVSEFSRMERMLLFAVVTECERCVCSEGRDCLDVPKSMGCPFVSVREEYGINDLQSWKERVR